MLLRLAFIACALSSALAGSNAYAYSNEFATPKTWLEGYRPNYFLYGNPDSKIQLSAKTQLLDEHHLYFAYTQVMFWNIREVSSPMRDVNFNPELFYRWILNGPSSSHENRGTTNVTDEEDDGSGREWIDFGLFEHESNGETGSSSRSWNRSYVRYTLESLYDETIRVYSSFKVWLPYSSSYDVGNSDILYYRGLFEIELTVAGLLGDRNDVTLRLYPGGPSHLNPGAGGQELTFRFGAKHLVPLWTIQVFNGVGESFLDYRDRRTMLRLGLSF